MIFSLSVTGPETLLRQSSDLGARVRPDRYNEADSGDAIEAHEWKCVRTINGNFSKPITFCLIDHHWAMFLALFSCLKLLPVHSWWLLS
jgi:hypothetical protein